MDDKIKSYGSTWMKEANRRNKLRECQPGNCTVVALSVRVYIYLYIKCQTKEGVCICTIKAESAAHTAAQSVLINRRVHAIFAARCKSSVAFLKRVKVSHFVSERERLVCFYRAREWVCAAPACVFCGAPFFSVTQSRSQSDAGRLGVSQAATHVFYRGPASKPKLRCTFSYRLSPLFAQPFKMLMSSFFISLASTAYKIPIKLTLSAGRLKK